MFHTEPTIVDLIFLKKTHKKEEMTQNVNKRPRRSKKIFLKNFVFFFVRPSGPTHPLISWFTGSSPSIEPPCNFFLEKKKCLDVRVRQHQHLAAFNNFLLFSPCFCCWFFFFLLRSDWIRSKSDHKWNANASTHLSVC